MKVLVVSGFLGAGKTTFIKELIRQTAQDIVILENEYGDTDLDKRELAAGGDIQVLDFVEGCVCCSMKEGFANSVMTVSSVLNPAFLVVEPTGAAFLSNVLRNLAKISYENITLLPAVTVISMQSILSGLPEYADIYNDQLKAADKIILSKCENEEEDAFRQAYAYIRARNPHAEILQNHYSTRTKAWWLSLLGIAEVINTLPKRKSYDVEAIQAMWTKKKSLKSVLYPALDCLSKEEREASLEECSFQRLNEVNPTQLIWLLDGVIRGRYGKIIRAKGVVHTGREHLRFDIAENRYTLSGAENYHGESQCVFIGQRIQSAKFVAFFAQKE